MCTTMLQWMARKKDARVHADVRDTARYSATVDGYDAALWMWRPELTKKWSKEAVRLCNGNEYSGLMSIHCCHRHFCISVFSFSSCSLTCYCGSTSAAEDGPTRPPNRQSSKPTPTDHQLDQYQSIEWSSMHELA